MIRRDGLYILPQERAGALVQMNDVPVPLAVVPDMNRCELYLNDAYLDMIGASRAELDDSSGAIIQSLHTYTEKDLEIVWAGFDEILNHDGTYAEYTVRVHAGVMGLRYHRVITKFTPEGNSGHPPKLVTTFTDVDDDVRGQRAVEKASNQAELLEADGDLGIVDWWLPASTERLRLPANVLASLNYSHRSKPNAPKYYLDVVHPQDVDSVRDVLLQSFTVRVPVSKEHRLITAEGNARWVRLVGRVFVTGTGRQQFVGLLLSVDARHQSEMLSRELQANLDEFVYAIAHELRAPVRHIQSFFSDLPAEEVGRLNKSEQEAVVRGLEATRSLGDKLDGLLDFVRLSSVVPKFESFLLSDLVNALVTKLNISDEVTVSIGELPVLVADHRLVGRLMRVLLENAIKFSSDQAQPFIQIQAQLTSTGECLVEVSDNGIGFDEQHSGQLFGLFNHLHTGHVYSGTGVGLAVARRIVRLHGGRIWAEAEVNKGARFFYTLVQPTATAVEVD